MRMFFGRGSFQFSIHLDWLNVWYADFWYVLIYLEHITCFFSVYLCVLQFEWLQRKCKYVVPVDVVVVLFCLCRVDGIYTPFLSVTVSIFTKLLHHEYHFKSLSRLLSTSFFNTQQHVRSYFKTHRLWLSLVMVVMVAVLAWYCCWYWRCNRA